MKWNVNTPKLIQRLILLPLFVLLIPQSVFGSQPRLASLAAYHRYIDPLLAVKDFGMEYYDDGAADASVLFPQGDKDQPYRRPVDPVATLIKLRARSIPLLVDCLTDNRVTSVRFDGNNITRPMNVPLGYVCLDILMAVVTDRSISDPDDCGDDGLGACIREGFYFRPDDYANCWKDVCLPRPWVTVVQRNWTAQFLAHRLRLHNPYDAYQLDQYKDLMTPKK
jgi:hypothetical protein